MEEKYTIRITEDGLEIISKDGPVLSLSAGEALMLLDILTQEKSTLRRMADDASPLPFRIRD